MIMKLLPFKSDLYITLNFSHFMKAQIYYLMKLKLIWYKLINIA